MTSTSDVTPYLEMPLRTETIARIQGHKPAPVEFRHKGGCTGSFIMKDGTSFALFDKSEDAAFGALAWNSHEALIKALDRALFLASCGEGELPEPKQFEQELRDLREIRDRAKGEIL